MEILFNSCKKQYNSKNMARPKSLIQDLKILQINVRVTLSEQLFLEESSKEYGISVVDFVRRKCLKKQLPKHKMSGINREVLIELSRIGNNINQLTKKVNQTNQCNNERLEDMLYFLKNQLDKIKLELLKNDSKTN